MTPKNEAAERLLDFFDEQVGGFYRAATLQEALATERLNTVERIEPAIHHALCDVSHHDSQSVCKNQRKYELVAESVVRFLEVSDASHA